MDLVNEFINLHSCPVNWEQETKQNSSPNILQFDWHYALLKNAVRPQDIVLDPEQDESWREDPELTIIVDTLKQVQEEAKELYDNRAGRLCGLHFLTPSKQGKHFVPNLSETEMLKRTRDGRPSLFFRDHNCDDLRFAFWQWFFVFFDVVTFDEYEEIIQPGTALFGSPRGRQWDRFLRNPNGPTWRICFENSQAVGASKGKLTPFLCFEIHLDNRVVHSYPITQEEASTMMGRDGVLYIHALSS